MGEIEIEIEIEIVKAEEEESRKIFLVCLSQVSTKKKVKLFV